MRFSARRLLHSSSSSQQFESVTQQPKEQTPVTALAMRGSNQLSLDTPKNNAGQY